MLSSFRAPRESCRRGRDCDRIRTGRRATTITSATRAGLTDAGAGANAMVNAYTTGESNTSIRLSVSFPLKEHALRLFSPGLSAPSALRRERCWCRIKELLANTTAYKKTCCSEGRKFLSRFAPAGTDIEKKCKNARRLMDSSDSFIQLYCWIMFKIFFSNLPDRGGVFGKNSNREIGAAHSTHRCWPRTPRSPSDVGLGHRRGHAPLPAHCVSRACLWSLQIVLPSRSLGLL